MRSVWAAQLRSRSQPSGGGQDGWKTILSLLKWFLFWTDMLSFEGVWSVFFGWTFVQVLLATVVGRVMSDLPAMAKIPKIFHWYLLNCSWLGIKTALAPGRFFKWHYIIIGEEIGGGMLPFFIEHLGEPVFFHQPYWAPDLVDLEFAWAVGQLRVETNMFSLWNLFVKVQKPPITMKMLCDLPWFLLRIRGLICSWFFVMEINWESLLLLCNL